ncbi:MAG: DUF4126 family protein [Actinomycetota bacterium]|jgi:hypothetical protein|nr:DUF4126 family protein [Solirubrobacterales bacterium]MBA3860395.1 DUF4126 family protein [Solirubrobacterales bacterium]MDQ3090432.1 DUF4126 family protein [Actinomycetota bacterium]MDQ3371097.1 DUF4126 family protein [Actinomycetota bacterium]MDQ3410245.1 DUF4126 family protein [Actinomycetota bacterium]
MNYVLDLLQGAGLGGAAGMRPFLPTLLAGALASADLGVDFEGTSFAFLEASWFLLLLVLCVVVLAVAQRRGLREEGAVGAALAGIAIGLGALLGAGSMDDRFDVWWPGLIVGGLAAALASAAVRSLLTRVRARLDHEAGAALPLYAEGGGLVLGGASVLFPPLALVGLGFLAFLLRGGRRREGEKYAGLRILR